MTPGPMTPGPARPGPMTPGPTTPGPTNPGDDPVAVAFDVTPLLGFRTGMGRSVAEMWAAVGRLGPSVRAVPYAIGIEGGGGSGQLPDGTRHIRLPTRALLLIWSRSGRVSMDHWLPPADVVHATNFTLGPTRRPTLITVHDIGFALHPSTTDAVTATFAGMLRRAIGRGAHLHVTTAHLARQVEEQFGPGLLAAGRVSVVPFGIPELGRPGPLPAGLGAALAGRPYVIAIGDQLERKNLPMLVRAFGRVSGALPELRLVLAGPEGPSTTAIREAVAALGPEVAGRVLLTGPVDDGARVALLAGAAVMAYPSLYEGFGLPPLEAMSLGVPTLVSRAGALAEVAGPGAQLLDPTDVDAWAEGIERLVNDEAQRRELIDAGHRHAARFGWEATGEGLAGIYRRLATSS